MENNDTNIQTQPKKKKSLVFPIILGALVIGSGIFGYNKYQYGLHHEDTDDSQITTSMAPVVSNISGYIQDVKIKDN